MIRFTLLFSSLLLFALASCADGTSSAAAGNSDAEATPSSTELSVQDSYGAPFTVSEVLPAMELTDRYQPDALQDTVETTLRGEVSEVCQAKGCWMTIAAGSDQTMMVKFKDYGFFMPKDISGREVVMNGKAYYQTTSVDELRHYAEDAGKSADEIAAITEPKRELRFLADGVQLLKN